MENLKSLIKKAQDSDLEAFGRIVRRFQDMAVGYAYSILGNFHLAEDAAQEAFIEAYCCLSRISNPDTFPGLFRKIVFKHCDRLTRSKRVETIPLEAAVEFPSSEKGPAEIVLEQELKDSVFQAIQALPSNQRIVTTLFYINGYSQNEISDFLEIPVTTVKKRLQYSRKRLKERMIKMVQDTLYENRPSRDEQFELKVLKGMAGSIAKTLRNPLDVISSIAQSLLTPPDDTKVYSESVQKICAEVQHASLIIENLQTFSGTEEKGMREIDLHAVLEGTFSLLAYQMALQKVTLQKELQTDLPMVCGSPELLQQVFTNLILNACNAMPQGGTLTVTTRATEAAEVEIQLSDTGKGIPQKYLPNIFHLFFTTMSDGMGFGLHITYSIIQQHQGTIEVESQVGKGTTFIITLPIRQEVKSQE